jgi:CBS domain-containing protein
MIKAREVMSKDIVTVKRDTMVIEAIRLLVESNISGLPVVEDDMSLVGLLSEKDVVELLYDIERAKSKTVGDYMTHPAVCFEESNALQNVCDFLMKNIFRRVPITSGGKLVGIISIRDILDYILQLSGEKVGDVD